MKQLTKDMLESGMRVILRNGMKYIVIGETLRTTCGHMNLCQYDENLLRIKDSSTHKHWDIVEVYADCPWNSNERVLGELLWKREELTEEQKQILELEETIKKSLEQIEKLRESVK